MNLYDVCVLSYSCKGVYCGWGCLEGREGCRSNLPEPKFQSTA